MRYTEAMKTTTIPSVRVTPALRADMEALLAEGESLSQFVETSVLEAVRRRRNQAEFVARGMAALAQARQADAYVDPDALLARLDTKLAKARLRRKPSKGAA